MARGYFRAVWFRTAHEHAHHAHVAAFQALDGVETLEVHHRRLSFLERERPFRPEYETRVVLHLAHRTTETTAQPSGGDPYRDISFERMTVLHPELGELVDQLGARHSEIGDAYVSFQTREYEAWLLGELQQRLDALGGTLEYELDAGTALPGQRLIARGRGTAPWAYDVRTALRESGLVDPNGIRIRYERVG